MERTSRETLRRLTKRRYLESVSPIQTEKSQILAVAEVPSYVVAAAGGVVSWYGDSVRTAP